MMEPGTEITIREVLAFARERGLVSLDERFEPYFAGAEAADDDGEKLAEARSVAAFLACRAAELWGYRDYVEDQSPFSTQQGVKGAEFDRVLVILDDEEGDYNLFSYGKYFGITPLSETDEKNLAEGSDSVMDRTRRLFYVCCSRAVQDLAVVFFVPDVLVARAAIETKGLFRPGDIRGLEALEDVEAPVPAFDR
jgi:DNA helicase-2/ATP-dependent DNA helicase PcrA